MKGWYHVYILASRSRVLYTGVTNDIERRVIEHRFAARRTFTDKFRVDQLVHLESYSEVKQAIAREKQIKGWRRAKRIALIEESNPDWRDLAAHLPRRDLRDD